MILCAEEHAGGEDCGNGRVAARYELEKKKKGACYASEDISPLMGLLSSTF